MQNLALSAEIGKYIFDNAPAVFRYSLYCLCAISALTFLFSKNKFANLHLITLGISAFSLSLTLFGDIQTGVLGFFAASLFALKTFTFDFSENKVTPYLPFLFISAIAFVAGIYLRTFYLSVITDSFEAELSPYMAAASSIHGSLIANKGVYGPWAPLGILYYIPIFLTYEIFGATLWSARLSSAIVGIVTVPVLFFTVKRLFNVNVALISCLLFSLNYLHIGWSRTDIHPHGVTVWPALLICLACYNYFTSSQKNIFSILFLVFSMGLCWHQYPSGQSAVAIPFIALSILVLRKTFSFKQALLVIPTLLIGAAIWYLGLPLSYYLADGVWDFPNPFTLTTQRTSWGNTQDNMTALQSLLFVGSKALNYFNDFLLGLIYEMTHLFHQDFVADIFGLENRTYAFLLIPFCLVGFLWSIKSSNRIPSAIMIAFFLAAIAPGILSERPYPKRMSVSFAVLDIFSALGIAGTFQLARAHSYSFIRFLWISLGYTCVIAWIVFLESSYFAGRQYPINTPIEVVHADEISRHIKPDTIIIADCWKDYDEGKFSFLLLDKLYQASNQPILLFFTGRHKITEKISKEFPYFNQEIFPINTHWLYRWTKLRENFQDLSKVTHWKNAIFILQERSNENNDINPISLIGKITDNCKSKPGYNSEVFWLEANKSFQNKTAVVVCQSNDSAIK